MFLLIGSNINILERPSQSPEAGGQSYGDGNESFQPQRPGGHQSSNISENIWL